MIEIRGKMEELERILYALKNSTKCPFELKCDLHMSCYDCFMTHIKWIEVKDDKL